MNLETPNSKVPGLRPGVIELPVTADELTMGYTPVDLTFESVAHVIRGPGTNVTWNIRYATTRNAGSPTDVWSSNQATTTKSGAVITTFTNGVIPAGNWIWLVVISVTGTISEFAAIPFVAGLR